MKIRFVHQYFFPDRSSVSQVISRIAFDLAEKGEDVSIICSRNRYDEGQTSALPSREVVRGVDIRRCWGPSLGRNSLLGRCLDMGSFCVSAALRLMLAQKADAVVFLTNPPLFSLFGVAVKRIRKERFIYILMDVYPDIAIQAGIIKKGGIAERVLRWIACLSLREADCIVVLGEDMRDVAIRSGAPPENVVVIRNWADPEVIHPIGPQENPFRKKWGLDEKFVIEYSGNLGVSHFFEDILAVVEDLLSFDDLRFVVIGGGVRYREVESFVRMKNLSNLTLMPYQEESVLAQSLSVGDVHYISLRHGFEGLVVPSKAYGIMAAGRPMIYQGDGGGDVARMIEREKIGFVIAPGDRQGLREAILTLYKDRALTEKMGALARRALEDKYSASIGLALYRKVLAGVN